MYFCSKIILILQLKSQKIFVLSLPWTHLTPAITPSDSASTAYTEPSTPFSTQLHSDTWSPGVWKHGNWPFPAVRKPLSAALAQQQEVDARTGNNEWFLTARKEASSEIVFELLKIARRGKNENDLFFFSKTGVLMSPQDSLFFFLTKEYCRLVASLKYSCFQTCKPAPQLLKGHSLFWKQSTPPRSLVSHTSHCHQATKNRRVLSQTQRSHPKRDRQVNGGRQ